MIKKPENPIKVDLLVDENSMKVDSIVDEADSNSCSCVLENSL